MSDINEALEQLTGSAMCSGAVFFLEKAKRGLLRLDGPLMDSLGDEPREFLKIRTDLTEPFMPRVLEEDWETVRDALDALPLGTVIKWSDDLGYSAAIKCPNVMGDARWFEAGVRNPRSSESIARDGTPIEVIA